MGLTRLVIALSLALLLLLSGCKSKPPEPKSPEPIPSVEPAPAPETPAGLYPPDFRTGTPKLDTLIDAYMRHDAQRLISLIRMTDLKCSNNRDAGFPCDGRPEGTVVPAFYRSTCQTWVVTEARTIEQDVRVWAEEPGYLYAVYEVKDLAPRAYQLVFAATLKDVAKSVYLDAEGKIVELGMGCNVPAPSRKANFVPVVAPRAK